MKIANAVAHTCSCGFFPPYKNDDLEEDKQKNNKTSFIPNPEQEAAMASTFLQSSLPITIFIVI